MRGGQSLFNYKFWSSSSCDNACTTVKFGLNISSSIREDVIWRLCTRWPLLAQPLMHPVGQQLLEYKFWFSSCDDAVKFGLIILSDQYLLIISDSNQWSVPVFNRLYTSLAPQSPAQGSRQLFEYIYILLLYLQYVSCILIGWGIIRQKWMSPSSTI